MDGADLVFERSSSIYDATRGGIERGKLFAADVAPWIDGGAGA